MKKANEGSCALLVIILSTIMLLYYMNSLQNLMLMDDLISKKYKHEKQFRNSEALYLYGVAICLNNFDTLLAHKQNNKAQTIDLYNTYWPQANNKYHGSLKIKFGNENEIFIEAQSYNDQQEIVKITASIIKDTMEMETEQKNLFVRFLIKNWQVNAD